MKEVLGVGVALTTASKCLEAGGVSAVAAAFLCFSALMIGLFVGILAAIRAR